MKTLLILVMSLVAFNASAGVFSGGGTPPPNKTMEIFLNQEMAQVIDVSKEDFAKYAQDSIDGTSIMIDGKPHVSDLVDVKNKQIFLKTPGAAPKLVVIKVVDEELEKAVVKAGGK